MELYDHQIDPQEHRNLAALSQYAPVIQEHRRWLPKKNALPSGKTTWETDTISRKLQMLERDGIPDWLGK